MPPLGQCTGFPQRLNVVQLSGDTASLDGTLQLPDNRQLFAVSQGDGVVFATLGNRREGAAPADLLVFGDDEAGELQHGMLGLQWPAQSRSLGYWPAPLVSGYGKRAVLTAGREVVLVDASEPSDPALLRRMAWSSATEYAEVHSDSALLTLGGRDAQWIELRD